MAKKTKTPADHADGTASSADKSTTPKPKSPEPSTSALIICRNKHWRYISSFHGPWLQLPPEVLESLAHGNYAAPRPYPIDPAIFYDLVKIRKAVDEATNLTVRATSGLTSAALNQSMNAGNGMLGSAAALGLGYDRGGANTKLSRERKYRMRELATQKLSQAYHLDEIAASVATMQSASTLEDVAQLVLQRSANDHDARYVHFFHEKIPSRMMAEYTPLDSLNEIIGERPTDGPPLRTRALTRLFKEDYLGAARDLTDCLAIARYLQQQHRAGKDQLILAKTAREEAERMRISRDWRNERRVADEDQPSSLETQCLFHRAGVYFTLACQHVNAALDGLKEFNAMRDAQKEARNGKEGEPLPLSPTEKEGHRMRLENRKLVKNYAKRAVRDYLAFLSHFEYSPGLSPAVVERFLRLYDATTGVNTSTSSRLNRLQELTDSQTACNGQTTDAVIPHQQEIPKQPDHNWSLPSPAIHPLSALFSSTPPADLPPCPPSLDTPSAYSSSNPAVNAFLESQEVVTYHPLLTDALHSLLLCHALIQTSPTELRRHAHNVARIARVCDGYPVFLAARSPARTDWIEVLRRAGNWIELTQTWEQLCEAAPLPGQDTTGQPKQETEAQKHDRQRQEAIFDALADERVVDEESFQRAVHARERRTQEDENLAKTVAEAASGSGSTDAASSESKRGAQDDDREYPISTERADTIARWVREAALSTGEGKRKGKKKSMKKKAGPSSSAMDLEVDVAGLGVDEGEKEEGEEDVDE